MKICAIVVTHNRKMLLSECLDALLHQTRPLDSIIVIDNASSDGTEKLLKEEFLHNSVIDYVRLTDNIGGSGGFYEGVKRSYGKGYDWLWLMDDDAEPAKDALEKLLEYSNQPNVVALAGKVLNSNGHIESARGYFNFASKFPKAYIKPLSIDKYNGSCIPIDFINFVGILINGAAIDKIGFPKAEFFIYSDDVEYCIRLSKVGTMTLVPSSVIYHKCAAGKDKSYDRKVPLLKGLRPSMKTVWRGYYRLRNRMFIGKNYSENKSTLYWRALIHLLRNLRSIVGIVLFDDNKYDRIKLRLLTYWDGLRGRLGKRVVYDSKRGRLKWFKLSYMK